MTVKRGISISARSTNGAKRARAGPINSLCHAPETFSGTTRLAPRVKRDLAGADDGGEIAADDDLSRRVEVRQLHAAAALRGAASTAARTPSASSPRIALIPPGDEFGRLLHRERPFASPAPAPSRTSSAPAIVRLQYSPNEWPALATHAVERRRRRGERVVRHVDRRLAEARLAQRFVGPARGRARADRSPESRSARSNSVGGDRRRSTSADAHADDLRALAREMTATRIAHGADQRQSDRAPRQPAAEADEQQDVAVLESAAARSASDSTIGIEADEVLPYRSTLIEHALARDLRAALRPRR